MNLELPDPGPVTWSRVVDGMEVRAALTLNRNASRALVPFGEGALQLTRAGTLQAWSADLSREEDLRVPAPVSALSAYRDGVVFAALGDVFTLAPGGQAVRAGTYPGYALWIGTVGDTLYVASADMADALLVTDVATGRSVAVPLASSGARARLPEAFHGDAEGRLWLGFDRGEWGGSYGWISPADASLHGETDCAGTRGFATLGDRLLAVGGYAHMSSELAAICEVTSDPPRVAYTRTRESLRQPLRDLLGRARRLLSPRGSPGRILGSGGSPPRFRRERSPVDPITWLASAGDEVLVAEGPTLWKTDPDFRRWRRVADLNEPGPVDRRGGDGDTVVGAVVRGGEVILATTNGGLRRVRGARVGSVRFSGQLRTAPELLGAVGGRVFGAWEDGVGALDLGDAPAGGAARWIVEGEPRFEKVRLDAEGAWYVGFDASRRGRNPLVFHRWKGDHWQVVERRSQDAPVQASGWNSGIETDDVFARCGGVWLAAYGERLLVSDEGAWRDVEALSWSDILDVRPVPGRADLLVDREGGALFRCDPGAADPLKLVLEADGSPSAAALPDGRVLLAVNGAVELLKADLSGTEEVPAPADRIFGVAVDGLGRRWFQGAGTLWMWDGALHDLSALSLQVGWTDAMVGTPEGVLLAGPDRVVRVETGGPPDGPRL